jgi:hypothetical protein
MGTSAEVDIEVSGSFSVGWAGLTGHLKRESNVRDSREEVVGAAKAEARSEARTADVFMLNVIFRLENCGDWTTRPAG